MAKEPMAPFVSRRSTKPKVRFNPISRRKRSSKSRSVDNTKNELREQDSRQPGLRTNDEVEKGFAPNETPMQQASVTNNPFAYVGNEDGLEDIQEALDSRGQLCEIHNYDVRQTSRGPPIVLQVGTKLGFEFHKAEPSYEIALVFYRNFSPTGKLLDTTLHVKSPFIRKALQEVIGSYTGVNLSAELTVILPGKPKCLYLYENELEAYASESKDPKTQEHVEFCLKYMRKAFQKEITTYKNMMRDSPTPGITYDELWMVFKPGALVYTKTGVSEVVCKFVEMADNGEDVADWELKVEVIETDGVDFGRTEQKVIIERYEGFRCLKDLNVFPLEYHQDLQATRERLISRGRKYAALHGIHYKMYDESGSSPARKIVMGAISVPAIDQPKQAQHRIMIDAYEHNARRLSKTFVSGSTIQVGSNATPELSNEELLLCSNTIPGYSLSSKFWSYYEVDHVHDIDFNTSAFDILALAQDKKEMIAALVRSAKDSSNQFDDMIRGKGKGIIFLLHGPPGVGKTYTAESIADLTRRPLFTLNCTSLGTDGELVESGIADALALATRWNAVSLIDEADVFMAERGLNDLARNELVSVLLRALEYHEGILFLTTNRAETIDPAFRSRIHLRIAYPNLSAESRQHLWRVFILKGMDERAPLWLDADFIGEIAKYDMNGRQIKNAVRVAHALAIDKQRELIPEDVFSVVRAIKSFEE